MSASTDKSKNPIRSKGREQACEGILRLDFGEKRTAAGKKAIAQLRQQADKKHPKLAAPTMIRWFVAAAAAVVFVGLLGVVMVTKPWQGTAPVIVKNDYPSPKATGGFSVVGGGAVTRGSSLATDRETAELTLGGYCKVEMLPSSAVRIEGENKSESIVLKKGKVKCSVKREIGEFSVQTDIGTVKVTGTEFEVQLLEKGVRAEEPGKGPGQPDESRKRMFVRVRTGSVTVSSEAGDIKLTAGEATVLPREAVPKTKMVEKEITVKLQTPNPSWSISIDEIYQVKKEIWVISTLEQRTETAITVISSAQDKVKVKVPDLPVKHFVLGKTWNWGDEPYEFLENRGKIKKDLDAGKLLHPSPKSNP